MSGLGARVTTTGALPRRLPPPRSGLWRRRFLSLLPLHNTPQTKQAKVSTIQHATKFMYADANEHARTKHKHARTNRQKEGPTRHSTRHDAIRVLTVKTADTQRASNTLEGPRHPPSTSAPAPALTATALTPTLTPTATATALAPAASLVLATTPTPTPTLAPPATPPWTTARRARRRRRFSSNSDSSSSSGGALVSRREPLRQLLQVALHRRGIAEERRHGHARQARRTETHRQHAWSWHARHNRREGQPGRGNAWQHLRHPERRQGRAWVHIIFSVELLVP